MLLWSCCRLFVWPVCHAGMRWKKYQHWPRTSPLLVWMTDFWVNNSPSGQFLTSPHSPYRVPPNNNHMLLASRSDCWAVSLCLYVHVCVWASEHGGRGARRGESLQNPGGCDVRRGWGCMCVWSSWVIATCWETRLVWFGPHVFGTEKKQAPLKRHSFTTAKETKTWWRGFERRR